VFGFLQSNGAKVSIFFQLILTSLAIALASYQYCFRATALGKDVAAVREQEDKEVNELQENAGSKTSAEGGVKL